MVSGEKRREKEKEKKEKEKGQAGQWGGTGRKG